MLAKLEIYLKTKDKFDYNISSLMQGVMMEFINEQYCQVLHRSNLKPYSQYVCIKDNVIKWTICSLSEESYNYIVKPIYNADFKNVFMKHKNLYLELIEKKLTFKKYEDLYNENYFQDTSSYINLKFITPTAFKSNNKYVIYPNMRNVYQSIMLKFDSNSTKYKLFNEEVLNYLETHTDIIQYNLKSVNFHMEGVKIPSFLGQIKIKINGAQTLVNLANYLFSYSTYCGIGIKTAMGMGAIILNEKKEQRRGLDE